MKKVLLTTLNAKYIHSSLALRSLQAYAKVEGLDLDIQEFTINDLNQNIMSAIYKAQPEVLGFSCYIWNIRSILEICNDFKKVSPHTSIILGGPEVSYDPQEVLRQNPCIDYVIRGEGEETLCELLYRINEDGNPHGISGVTARFGDVIIHNPDRDLLPILDMIPFPYSGNDSEFENKIVYYETSRGCPFNCTYCLSSTIKGVRLLSTERVISDLSILLTMNAKEIKFVDRTFNCDEERSIEIMSYIIENIPGSKVHFEIEANHFSDKMLRFLASVPPGIFNFEIGIQSTCEKALNSVKRGFNRDKLLHNIKTIRSYNNIHLHLDLIAGLPFEGYTDFAHSFNTVYELRPDLLQLGFLKLLKGSEIRSQAEEHAYIYQAQPPYQVLSNRYLSYNDILKMTQIEAVLDSYFNSHYMKNSLQYIIREVYKTDTFTFFEDLSAYWEERDYHAFGHKKEAFYSYLKDFIDEYHQSHSIIVNDLIKYDYLLSNQSSLLPSSIVSFNPDQCNELLYSYLKDTSFIDCYLPFFRSLTVRKMRKQLHLEFFQVNPHSAALSTRVFPIMFVYDSKEKIAIQAIILK